MEKAMNPCQKRKFFTFSLFLFFYEQFPFEGKINLKNNALSLDRTLQTFAFLPELFYCLPYDALFSMIKSASFENGCMGIVVLPSCTLIV